MGEKSGNLATSTLPSYIARLVISDVRQNEHPTAWAPTSDWLSARSVRGHMLDAAARAFMDSSRRARWKPTSTAARVRSLCTRPAGTSRGGSQPVRVSRMRSQAIVRELVKQLMQADADEEHRKRMRKILKTRNYPDEDDDDPIDADPMRF
jgi:hypothetical protein